MNRLLPFVESKSPLKLSEGQCFAGKGFGYRHVAVVSLVGALLFASFPPAVFGCVRTVVVDSSERFPAWGLSQVGEEQREVVPPRTNGDSASTISGVVLRVGVETAPSHVFPDVVGSRVREVFVSVVLSSGASLRAATRGVARTAKFSSTQHTGVSAVTLALPQQDAVWRFADTGEDRQSPNLFSGHLDSVVSSHKLALSGDCHRVRGVCQSLE